MPKIYLNDRIVDAGQACIDPSDAGLLHGVGLFTTLRVYNRKPFRLDLHLGRLMGSARALELPLRHNADQIADAAAEVIEANGLDDARMRITVTRGPTGAAEPESLPPSTLLIAATGEVGYPQAYYEQGMTVALAHQRINPTDPMGGHKTLNYWGRLMILQAARAAQQAGEALWFTLDGHVACGCISNVFVVREGKLLTPPLDTPVLPGVTRATVIELARSDNIEVEERPIPHDELFEAEEVFLTNSIMQVMPVVLIERHPIPADQPEPRPGPLTRALAQLYQQRVEEETA